MRRLRWMLGMALSGVTLGLGCNLLIGLDAGQPICDGVRCDDPPPCHGAGTCAPSTGKCVYPALGDGTECDDGNGCTEMDTCNKGVCVGEAQAALRCGVAGACQSPACNPATGTCASTDGTPCDDGDTCTATDTCQGGICNPEHDHTWAHWHPDLKPDYVIGADTVGDRVTHLTWQRKAPTMTYSWQEATQLCGGLSLPGFPSGWRLPTKIELLSIVKYEVETMGVTKIDDTAFPETSYYSFWTSSPVAGSTTDAWQVHFGLGTVVGSPKTDRYLVRCVR